jgi:hypothetical protein
MYAFSTFRILVGMESYGELAVRLPTRHLV